MFPAHAGMIHKQNEYEIAFNQEERATLPKSKATAALENAFRQAGIDVKYNPRKGYLVFNGKGLEEVESISEYMEQWYNNIGPDATSELIAEGIRYVATHGEGSNEIADIVAGEVLEWF